MTREYRPDIDGLRALAVGPVVLFHAGMPGVTGGYVGVDIFFVISGFLITGILAREFESGTFSLVRFYERRARRILPALIVTLAATLAAGALLSSPDQFVALAKSTIATAAFLSNVFFMRLDTGYFSPDVELQPLLHTWSLAVEEQFYIVFPLLLWALFRAPRRFLLPAIGAICIASFALAAGGLALWPKASFYMALPRAWELGLGALLALGILPPPSRRAATVAGLLGLAAILATVILYHPGTPFPGLAALPPCLGAAALIWSGTCRESPARALLALRPLVAIGLVSYSLYLWHWPVLAFSRLVNGSTLLPAPAAAAAVALSLVLAWVSLLWIERPFRERPPVGPSRGLVFGASAAGLAALLAVAGLVLAGGGLDRRFGPAVRLAFAGAHDVDPGRDRCMNRPPEKTLCAIGATADGPAAPADDGHADFLLWGDSHAGALMPAVDQVATGVERSGLFAARTACAPLLGLNRPDQGRSNTCARTNDEVLALLKERADMPVVILAARWALLAEGYRAEGEAGAPALLAPPGTPAEALAPEANFRRFADALPATVAAIRATGREVVLVGDVPEIGWSVPDRLGSSLHLGFDLAPPTRAEVRARTARADAVLREAAADAGVTYVPLASELCDPDCPVVREGRSLYVDDDHLSRFGALAMVAPILRDSLLPVLLREARL